jgi:hypothetical protein
MAIGNFDNRGSFTVTLGDRTVWRQDSTDPNFARVQGNPSI